MPTPPTLRVSPRLMMQAVGRQTPSQFKRGNYTRLESGALMPLKSARMTTRPSTAILRAEWARELVSLNPVKNVTLRTRYTRARRFIEAKLGRSGVEGPRGNYYHCQPGASQPGPCVEELLSTSQGAGGQGDRGHQGPESMVCVQPFYQYIFPESSILQVTLQPRSSASPSDADARARIDFLPTRLPSWRCRRLPSDRVMRSRVTCA